MKPRRLLRRLSQGALHNVAISDMIDLTEAPGFHLDRVSGSHHIFSHPDLAEILNLQSVRGEAKPYQVRQLLRIVEKHNLTLEGSE